MISITVKCRSVSIFVSYNVKKIFNNDQNTSFLVSHIVLRSATFPGHERAETQQAGSTICGMYNGRTIPHCYRVYVQRQSP